MSAATHSLLAPRPSKLGPFLALSVAGHAVVVLVALILSWLFAGPRIDLTQKPIKASLVRLGKPRDEKLLPRKEEPPPPPKAEKTVEPVVKAPVDAKVAIPTKDAKPDAPTSLADAFSKTAREAKPEELEGALDGDPDGDAARQEGERYHGLLVAVVKRHYDVSDTIPEAERRALSAQVAMRVGPRGELLDVRLAKSSGNDVFDSAVLGAVKKASPFAPPPEHLRDAMKSTGVAFVFTP